MARFGIDKTREESLTRFLHKHVYPLFTSHAERITTEAKQKKGHDAEITFDWESTPKIVDEKAQTSNMYINDPTDTFVLELFGESWTDRDTYGNIGWFLDETIETDYYVFVWLPDVSLFRVNSDFNTIEYHPADAVSFTPDTIFEHSYSPLRHSKKTVHSSNGFTHHKFCFTAPDATKILTTDGGYGVTLRNDVINAFSHSPDPLPTALTSGEPLKLSEWYYDPCHVYEANVLVVSKQALEEKLCSIGLDKQTLKQHAVNLVENNNTQLSLDSKPGVKKIIRSQHTASGCDESETPVNIVVNYETYHEAAVKTLKYTPNKSLTDIKLF
jgi:hypothetical protein